LPLWPFTGYKEKDRSLEEKRERAKMPTDLCDSSDEEFVDQLYQTLLGRKPDAEGRRHYVETLRQGASRLAVVSAFLSSEEFLALREAHPFVPPGHYYSPIPSQKDLLRYRESTDTSPDLLPGINLNEEGQRELVAKLQKLWGEAPWNSPGDPLHPRYRPGNPAFGRADADVLFGLIGLYRPKKIVEVGCGHSSCAILDARDHFGLSPTTGVHLIDLDLSLVRSLLEGGSEENLELWEGPVWEAPPSIFQELDRGDILFMDSSHVVKFGSDLHFLFFEVIPRLRAGVILGFHDVFWPFEYPIPWLKEGRAWNEAYFLRAFLLFNRAFSVLVFTNWLLRRTPQGFFEKNPWNGTSLFLEKTL
jgi:hypothetical protein